MTQVLTPSQHAVENWTVQPAKLPAFALGVCTEYRLRLNLVYIVLQALCSGQHLVGKEKKQSINEESLCIEQSLLR